MVSPIKKMDLAEQVIEELRQQLAVTEAVLVKILNKTGTVKITGEELQAPVSDETVVDMDFDEQSEVWTFSLKEDPIEEP